MSKISTIYDGIYARVAGLFPSKLILTDVIELEENTERALENGYGIRIEAGNNPNLEIGCNFSVQREFVIILTREIESHHQDLEGRKIAEKALLEDQYEVIKAFENNDDFSGVSPKQIWGNDGGFQRVFNDQRNFLAIETTISVEYSESLT